MYGSERHQSTTRATLTEGTIILNKDSTPTQTTAAALGINTDMHSANTPVSAPKEIQRVLQEQVQLREAVGHIATGIDSYIASRKQTAGKEAEVLTQEVARLQRQGDTEKIGEKQTALKLAEQEKMRWETGGDYKRNADIIKALVTTSIAGKAPTEIAVSAASPIVNNYIKDVTKENLPANLLAHATWSALEAKTAGSDAVAGAVAGGGGELLAHTAATFLYDVDGKTKTVAHLTETEKNNLNALSQLGAGIAGGIIGDNSYSAINSAQIAQRAVENNYLFVNEAKEKAELERKIQQGTATQKDKERHAQLNALDITRDNRVTVACQNKLSSSCQTERVLLNQAYAGYFANSTASNYYGYPVYTRNNLLYSQDADKVAGFVAEYDLLKALKEQNIRDLANKYNLDENRIKQWESWLNVGANVTAGIAGHKLATTTPAVIPKGANANEKLPPVGETKGYENQTTRISTGAENVALYPKLKEQLVQENLHNIGRLDPKLQEVVEQLGSNTNYSIKGISTHEESSRLGRLWVGDNYSVVTKGDVVVGWNSEDGLRGYRFPTQKPNSNYAETGIQANFETYKINPINNKKEKIGNAHLNIMEKK